MDSKKVTFVGVGNITENIVKQLLTSKIKLNHNLKLTFLGHNSRNPNRVDNPFPIKGIIETFYTSLIAEDKDINSNIIIDDNYFSTDIKTLDNSDFVVITAGAFPSTEEIIEAQKNGTDRDIQLVKNLSIIEKYAKEIKKRVSDNIPVLITTNPVDVLTEYFRYESKMQNNVLGLGGGVDSARYKYLLAKKLGISPKDIEVLVGVMHGGFMQPFLNTLKIKGVPYKDYGINNEDLIPILEKLKSFGGDVSKASLKYYNIDSGDSNTPAAVIKEALISYFSLDKEQKECYNHKEEKDKTGWQKPLNISSGKIEKLPIEYSKGDVKQINSTQKIIAEKIALINRQKQGK